MAQDLFNEIKYLPLGDFTKEDIIKDNIIIGKKLPTSTSIYKSDKTQIVFLELWNETQNPISAFVKVGNKIYMNDCIEVCSEEKYAHTFHQIYINAEEEVFASAEKENSISYNIIL